MMDKCQGIFGKIFGHAFRVAITKGAPDLKLRDYQGGRDALLELMEKTRPETYHGIYCKRCGKVING
ncbi:TPA: hypothetical protein ACWX8V_002441 [Klebsiella quasipneumoniae]|nr:MULTISPECIES: hypothetical protein [Klebsiella]HDH1361911.1 hypothetical protein [Klebsiella quasipneumoniae subsp. similipneumoniae]HDS4693840.1 hypothetical protein [Klebsiella pneumoniae subsp. pneumoniae]EKZ5585397.1 hypothetical protein [Klebsiella pneumoniae]EKZ6022772.1 hypothetical protein [Klebsiella pneumoniae]ELA2904620.1 hypothetical protein [Klebsiella pneumoniae]